MSAPRPFETDPFHPLGSICNIKQLLYICKNLPVISSMWDAQVCVCVYIHICDTNCACALAETFILRLRAIFKLIIFFLSRVNVEIWLLSVRSAFYKSVEAKSQRAIRLHSCESIFIIFTFYNLRPLLCWFSLQNCFKCCDLHDLIYIFLDNGVMTIPKRRILSFVFTVLTIFALN